MHGTGFASVKLEAISPDDSHAPSHKSSSSKSSTSFSQTLQTATTTVSAMMMMTRPLLVEFGSGNRGAAIGSSTTPRRPIAAALLLISLLSATLILPSAAAASRGEGPLLSGLEEPKPCSDDAPGMPGTVMHDSAASAGCRSPADQLLLPSFATSRKLLQQRSSSSSSATAAFLNMKDVGEVKAGAEEAVAGSSSSERQERMLYLGKIPQVAIENVARQYREWKASQQKNGKQ